MLQCATPWTAMDSSVMMFSNCCQGSLLSVHTTSDQRKPERGSCMCDKFELLMHKGPPFGNHLTHLVEGRFAGIQANFILFQVHVPSEENILPGFKHQIVSNCSVKSHSSMDILKTVRGSPSQLFERKQPCISYFASLSNPVK